MITEEKGPVSRTLKEVLKSTPAGGPVLRKKGI